MAQVSPYDAKDILELLREQGTLSEGIQKFFYYDSKFFRALRKYIEKCEVGHCPFVDLHHPLRVLHSMSPIQWRKAYAHPPGAGADAPNVIRVCFKVDMWDDEWERDVDGSGMVDVPHGLVTHFTQEKFDEWAAEWQETCKEKRLEEGKEKLADLLKRYPELSQEN